MQLLYNIKQNNVTCQNAFYANPSASAVQYIVNHSGDNYWKSQNVNEDVVDHLIQTTQLNLWSFYGNSSCMAVNHILSTGWKIDWVQWSANSNPTAVAHTLANPHKIYWPTFALNTNELAVSYLLENCPDNIVYEGFSQNSADMAVAHLLTNKHCINWDTFWANSHPMAVEYMLSNLDKITPVGWKRMATNTNPVIVEQLCTIWKEHIYWPLLASNPSIFEEEFVLF